MQIDLTEFDPIQSRGSDGPGCPFVRSQKGLPTAILLPDPWSLETAPWFRVRHADLVYLVKCVYAKWVVAMDRVIVGKADTADAAIRLIMGLQLDS